LKHNFIGDKLKQQVDDNSSANDRIPEKTRARILVVDDEPRNTKLIKAMLAAEGYSIDTAGSGSEALAAVRTAKPDLVLLDVMMPDMTGFDVAAALKLDTETHNIPIIMVSSLDDRASKLTALGKGAEEFLTKPIDRAELIVRTRNLLRLKELADLQLNYARVLEERVAERSLRLTNSYRDTITALNRAASYRDEETGAHVQRISHYCVELAQALGMDSAFRECIYYASPMHDIGKIAIPDRILLKPGKLTGEEWEIMKTHAALGSRMLDGVDSPYIEMGRDIAMRHHERWDGRGYPDGLAGEEIPLSARVMSIADVYDALRSRRPYKEPYEHDDALRIIMHGDGRTSPKHFDPCVLSAFAAVCTRMRDIYEAMIDLPNAKAA
jgi:putative two-component system response regulator